MARRRYLVAYDISDAGRLRAVHATMKGFGLAFQYSVFICDLDVREKIDMRIELGQAIDHGEDRIAIIDLGPLDTSPDVLFEFLGRRSALPIRGPQVL